MGKGEEKGGGGLLYDSRGIDVPDAVGRGGNRPIVWDMPMSHTMERLGPRHYIVMRPLLINSALDTMILDNRQGTPKHCKTHLGGGLITDPVAYITDADADLWSK